MTGKNSGWGGGGEWRGQGGLGIWGGWGSQGGQGDWVFGLDGVIYLATKDARLFFHCCCCFFLRGRREISCVSFSL